MRKIHDRHIKDRVPAPNGQDLDLETSYFETLIAVLRSPPRGDGMDFKDVEQRLSVLNKLKNPQQDEEGGTFVLLEEEEYNKLWDLFRAHRGWALVHEFIPQLGIALETAEKVEVSPKTD